MNEQLTAWLVLPITLAIIGVTLVTLKCLRRREFKLQIKGLGVEIYLASKNTASDVKHEDHQSDDNVTTSHKVDDLRNLKF